MLGDWCRAHGVMYIGHVIEDMNTHQRLGYGAFGWAEGIPMMKYLTDHMLVNGINYFVPHAFSPRLDELYRT